MGEEKKNFSENISSFCKLIDEARADYGWYESELNRLEKLQQDYLHMLELEDLKWNERAKVGTKLRNCRQERREAKDAIEILTPLIEYADSDKGRYAMNQLREVLGKTRKIEKRLENRTYTYRVYKKEDD